jgi:hypothetical protein
VRSCKANQFLMIMVQLTRAVALPAALLAATPVSMKLTRSVAHVPMGCGWRQGRAGTKVMTS